MNPIEFEVQKKMPESAEKICEKILDVSTWSDFAGHGILPGIEKAEFKRRTDEIKGARVLVKNSDGTQHIEDILEWESGKRIVMKIHGFPTSLSFVATHFIEEWNFKELSENETLVKRKFMLFPVSFLTRPFLSRIAKLFEKAVNEHLDEMAKGVSKN